MMPRFATVGFVIVNIALVVLIAPTWSLEESPLRLEYEPAKIVAPEMTMFGTEVVTFKVTNVSATDIQFPNVRWLVVERMGNTEQPIFTPMPPYTPLQLTPGDSIKVVWRLREPTDVQFVSGVAAKVSFITSGDYVVRLYYRSPEDKAWLTHQEALRLEASKVSSVLTWGIGIVIMLAIGYGVLSSRIKRD